MSIDEKRSIRIDWLWLATLTLGVNLLTLFFQKVPGYMDAEYYFAGALNLFRGNGFTENYIWNTLGFPSGLPAASHLYWMPLPSILGWIGLWIGDHESYLLARIPFLLITAILPLLTYQFTKQLGGDQKIARIAGLMTVFPGVYLVYLSLVEAFSPYMLLGGILCLLAFLLLEKKQNKSALLLYAVAGVLSAFMHLTRADGILWLGFYGLIPVYWMIGQKQWRKGLLCGLVLLLSYSLIMFPWYFRNWQLFHQLFPPGNQYTLYLTGYNDNFIFPVEQLTFQRWLSSGWLQILSDRLKAAGSNLLTMWMIHFQIVLIPFFIVWIRNNRKKLFVHWLLLCYVIQFLFMSLIFPYAGMRGGFLHSGSAFQLVFWAGSAVGLFQSIQWWMKKRGHFDNRIQILLSGGVIFLLGIVTVMMYQQKVFGTEQDFDHWQQGSREYTLLNTELLLHGISPAASVMINNPPGFALASQRTAIVVPNADTDGVIALADQYQIDYLILDTHIVPELASFYTSGDSIKGLQYEFSVEDFKIYSFTSGAE